MDRAAHAQAERHARRDIDALTTFLLGCTDPSLPPEYMYKPADQRAAIQKGWWIVTKYNCIGCHQIGIGQKIRADGPAACIRVRTKQNLPPVLTSEGARVNPEWLQAFPGQSVAQHHGHEPQRRALSICKCACRRSISRTTKFARWFCSSRRMSSQPQPFIPQKIEPLTTAEKDMARQLFTSTAAPCLKCHATGDPAHDKNAIAPNFLLAKDRLQPAWTERWITNPALIIPGTAMPSGLFKRDGDRWVFSGTGSATLEHYTGDQAESARPLHVLAYAARASRACRPHAERQRIEVERRELAGIRLKKVSSVHSWRS